MLCGTELQCKTPVELSNFYWASAVEWCYNYVSDGLFVANRSINTVFFSKDSDAAMFASIWGAK